MCTLSRHLFSLCLFTLFLLGLVALLLFLDSLRDEGFLVWADGTSGQRLGRSALNDLLTTFSVTVLTFGISPTSTTAPTIPKKLWQEDVEVFFFELVSFRYDFVEALSNCA